MGTSLFKRRALWLGLTAALAVAPVAANAATYDTGFVAFELDEVQGGFDGTTYATDAAILCGAPDSPACPEDGPQPIVNTLGTLWPTDTDFGFYVVDFYGAAGKVRDAFYDEGFIGPITDPESDAGLLVSNSRTDRFKTARGDGTWCAGMGGTSVKCSTENFTVMEHVLTCYETIPYSYADPVTGQQGDLTEPGTEPPVVVGSCADYELTGLGELLLPDGIDDILDMPPNESDLFYLARDPEGEYSVTKKDDGKFLMRWGNFIKRPNDVRVHKVLPLPAEWKEPGANFQVTKALLYVDHWITNNPNDQVRPEDMENEDARGRKPGYVILEDGSWVSNRDCYEGDGDEILAGTYLKNLTSYTPPSPCPPLEDLTAGDDPDCAVGDLKEGLTNAWSTSIDREPFEWSYRCEMDLGGGLTEVDFLSSPTPLDPGDPGLVCTDGSTATLESGPRWRLTPNKFGQDIPGLEIPIVECSPLPFQSDNIKYRTGTRYTTVLDMLDWSPREDGPMTDSKEWVYAGQNFQNLDVDGNAGCGSDELTDSNCLSINGVEMTEDFDLIWYVKGDRKPTVVYSARLYLEYGDPTDTDLAMTKTADETVPVGDPITYTLTVTNNGPLDATGVTITDTLPTEVSFVSSAECTESAGTVTCAVGDLTAGASAGASIIVTAVTEGTASNTACASADQGELNPDNNCATADTGIGDVPVAVDDSAGTVSDLTVNIDVLTNDNLGVEPVSVSPTAAVNGVTAVQADNSVDYTQNGHALYPDGEFDYLAACASCHLVAGFTGTDTFTYTLTDANGASDGATVTVDVISVDPNGFAPDLSGNQLSSCSDVPHGDCQGLTDAEIAEIGNYLSTAF